MRRQKNGHLFEIARGGMYNGVVRHPGSSPQQVIFNVYEIFSHHMIEQEDKKDWTWRDPPGTTKTFAEVTQRD
jgi:hypothetical protein